MPLVVCSVAYNTKEYGHVQVGNSHLCAGVMDGSAGTCVVSNNEKWYKDREKERRQERGGIMRRMCQKK